MNQPIEHTPAPTMEHSNAIQVSEEARAHLDAMRKAMLLNVAQGNHPSFEHMVANLFKNMDDPIASLLHATIGISGEAGELLDAVKKTWVYGKALDGRNVIEELSDLRFYYQAALLILGLDDLHIKAYNMDKLVLGENARYKTGFYSDAQAVARADKVAEQAAISGARDPAAVVALDPEGDAAAEAKASTKPMYAKVFKANTSDGSMSWAWHTAGSPYANESGFECYESARLAAEAQGYEVTN